MTIDQVELLYAGSNGQYYTSEEVRRERRRGEWQLCLRQRDPDRIVVETADRTLLFLTRVPPHDLPEWAEIRIERGRARVVDTRRCLVGAVPTTRSG